MDVTGQLSLTGTTNVNFNFLQSPVVGSYPFLRYAPRPGRNAGAGVTGYSWHGQPRLLFGNNGWSLRSPRVANALALTWRGSGNTAAWDLTTATNWTVPAGTADKFFQNDSVTFNETGAVPTSVNIATAVAPSSVVVNSSGANV